MLGLKLRDEFLGSHMPGTAISLRTSDNQGAVQKPPEEILSITYPTADVITAIKALSTKRNGRPIVIIGERGFGKSHIMAVMHHAISHGKYVESWLQNWGENFDNDELKNFEIVKGYFPISEPIHNNEYPLLWDLLFQRHPRGEYFRGQFEQIGQSFPPRTLLEKMFEDQPVCLILDEFQTWFSGLPAKDLKTGYCLKDWAFNFIQILSEIAKERPDIFILVISVRNNQNDAFQQVHRQGPVLIDFRGPTAKKDRQRLLLHRLFDNRNKIPADDIRSLSGIYAEERFRLLHSDKTAAEKDRICNEVFDYWPFSPELVELLENNILLSQAAQETRDFITILAQVYRTRGEIIPVITPADFFVDGDSGEVQAFIDSIAVEAGQEKLRQIAQQNLQMIHEAGIDAPNARELVSSIWMHSMSPGKDKGVTPPELHLHITRTENIDDNKFRAEITQVVEHCSNLHGDETASNRLWLGLQVNPRSKVRSSAKNNKLWETNPETSYGQTTFQGKDIKHIRDTLRHLMEPESRQAPTRIIVLGPKWEHEPWDEVDELDKPNRWERPVLIVIPEQLAGKIDTSHAALGTWLVRNVPKKRNTVHFLILAKDAKNLFKDFQLIYSARCSYLCSKEAWGEDPIYSAIHTDFDRPFRDELKTRFNRFAILKNWNYQEPGKCRFDIEKISDKDIRDISTQVENKILDDLFDLAEFKKFLLKRAKDSDFVGSVLDDLLEPPPPNTGDAIPYLGETRIFEAILKIAADGDIALNVEGEWICRKKENATNEDALRYIRQKAFRSGQEMRKIQLGLPAQIGGGSVATDKSSKKEKTGEIPGGADKPVVIPHPGNGGERTGSKDGTPVGPVIDNEPPGKPPIDIVENTKRTDEPASGINLSGLFEKWGIQPDQTIDTARLELKGLTAQQIKQILQRIPSSFKASLELIYTEGDE